MQTKPVSSSLRLSIMHEEEGGLFFLQEKSRDRVFSFFLNRFFGASERNRLLVTNRIDTPARLKIFQISAIQEGIGSVRIEICIQDVVYHRPRNIGLFIMHEKRQAFSAKHSSLGVLFSFGYKSTDKTRRRHCDSTF